MTTTTRSIKSISASCKKIRKSKARGRCVKHAKALRSGKSNYMTYKGQQAQKSYCNKLKRSKTCKAYCDALAKFYPGPTKKSDCRAVGKEWTADCRLRVLKAEARKKRDRKAFNLADKRLKALARAPTITSVKIPEVPKTPSVGFGGSSVTVPKVPKVPSVGFGGSSVTVPKVPKVPSVGFGGSSVTVPKVPKVPSVGFGGSSVTVPKVPKVPSVGFGGSSVTIPKVPKVPSVGFGGSNVKVPKVPKVGFGGSSVTVPKVPKVPSVSFGGSRVKVPKVPKVGFGGSRVKVPKVPKVPSVSFGGSRVKTPKVPKVPNVGFGGKSGKVPDISIGGFGSGGKVTVPKIGFGGATAKLIKPKLPSFQIPKVANPYVKSEGSYRLTPQEIDQIKTDFNVDTQNDEGRISLINQWNSQKKAEIREGLRSEGEMKIIQNYFAKRIQENQNLISSQKQLLSEKQEYYQLSDDELKAEYNKLSAMEANFAKTTWNDYEWVKKRNSQKQQALNKLARVSCEVGGSSWHPACARLRQFQADQKQLVYQTKFNQEAYFADYEFMIKSDAEMQEIRSKYENHIKRNNYNSINRQKDIRGEYTGTRRAQIIQGEFLQSFQRNRRLWSIYQRLDLTNRNRKSELRRMKSKLNKKIEQIYAGGKSQEQILLNDLV